MKENTSHSAKAILLTLIWALSTQWAQAQSVGIGTPTPNSSAMLDVTSSTKGILIPRVALTSTSSPLPLVSFVEGMMVYNTATAGSSSINFVYPGFYYCNGSKWVKVSGNDWSLEGNFDTSPNTNYIGTADNVDVVFKRNNERSGYLGLFDTSWGRNALRFLNGGQNNTAVGVNALLLTNTGNSNTALGYNALVNNTVGYSNVAIGTNALNNSVNKSNLVAIGDSALFNNGTGVSQNSINATRNTAVGSKALFSNIIGFNNTANGFQSLYSNNTGFSNTSNGYQSLYSNIYGSNNTAQGYQSLYSNTEGDFNIGVGYYALYNNTIGDRNVALGVAAGLSALGDRNVFLGNSAGSLETGSNKLYIANAEGDSNGSLIYGEFDTNKLQINKKLGIGMLPATFPLEIKGVDSGNSDLIKFYDSSGIPKWHFTIRPNGALSYTETGVADNRLVLQPGGNIGIGNASPNAPLQFSQNSNQNRKIVLYEDSNNDHQFHGFGFNSGGITSEVLRYQVSSGFSSHIFYAATSSTTSQELMRIAGNGTVTVPGTLSASTINSNTANFSNLTSANTTFTANVTMVETSGTVGVGATPASNSKMRINGTGYTNALYIVGSPVRDNSNVFWDVASDKNLKRNINEYNGGLAEIVQMKPVKYYYTAQSGLDTEHEKIGLVAQDVELIAPNMVENKLDQNGKSFKSLNLSPILFMYINAFKELDSQNKAKDQKIAALESRLERLERLVGK